MQTLNPNTTFLSAVLIPRKDSLLSFCGTEASKTKTVKQGQREMLYILYVDLYGNGMVLTGIMSYLVPNGRIQCPFCHHERRL